MVQPTISRAALAQVDLPAEVVEVPALGGAVRVRGMSMPQFLHYAAARRRLALPLAGEDEAAAAERANAELVPLLLHMCVVLDDGLPAYSAAEWGVLGVRHVEAVLDLFSRAMRLSGQDAEAEKKT